MTGDEWVRVFSVQLGQEIPGAVELELVEQLGALVEITAGPLSALISCWLVGRSGLDLPEAIRVARYVATWDDSLG